MQQYFVEQAESYDEACRKVREKYGDRANILLRKTVLIPAGFLGLFPKEVVEVSGPIPAYVKNINSYAAMNSGAEYAYEPSVMQEFPGKAAPVNREQVPPKEPGLRNDPGPMRKSGSFREPVDFEEAKKKVLAAANRGDPTLQLVLSEVRTIKEKIDSQGLPSAREEHPTLGQLDEILTHNDFPPSYRAGIIERAKKEFSLEALNDYDAVQDKVLEWIGESIAVFREENSRRRPRIMALVGPTGVGKTTTIAKLAANFGIDGAGKRIRQIVLITIDAFRIGAKQQLEAYGNILEFPYFPVEDYSELKRVIAMNADTADFILIDTIGKSPRDMVKLGEMKQLLDACGSVAEVHLAIAATTKCSDMTEILRQFEPFNYRSVIVTKLDETIRAGNVIGALAEKQKSVSYITNGQKVPADIRKASPIQFLTNLEGFKVNRVKLEAKFPGGDAEQMREWR
jgi:flagellar biosynthesis protein FlhF